jgi:hypothetical protein
MFNKLFQAASFSCFRRAVSFFIKSHIPRIVASVMSHSPASTPPRPSLLARETTALQQVLQMQAEDAAARRETSKITNNTHKPTKLDKLQAQAKSLHDAGVRNGTKCVDTIQ